MSDDDKENKSKVKSKIREELEKLLDLHPPPPAKKPPPPPENSGLSSLRNDMLFELFTGDAMIRGLTDLGYDYLKNMKGDKSDYRRWGLSSFDRGLYEIALNYFRKYFKEVKVEEEKDTLLLNSAGLCMVRARQFVEGIEVLNHSLKIDYINSDTHNYLGIAYYNQDEFGKALAYFKYSISLNSTKPSPNPHVF